jgi:FkbM family methyltransferase
VGRNINRLTATRYGQFLYNPNDLYVGRALELYGEAHEIELQLLRQLCGPGSIVFDVGANIGDHTVPLAQHVGDEGFVYAFEPQRIVFQILCANVALNGLVNVECVHAALGESPGVVHIPRIDYAQTDNYGGVEVDRFSEGEPVARRTLDDYVALSRADLIKIDVEGMESAVLSGGAQFIARFRPVMYVENDRLERSGELIGRLQTLEYRLFWHLSPLFNEANFRGNKENVFENVVAANMLCIPREVPFETTGPAFSEITDPAEHPFKPSG